MRQQVQARLAELKSEYEKGQMRLQQLDGELTALRGTMLRISGAIQVLEEIQKSEAMPGPADSSVNGERPEIQDSISRLS